MFGKLIMFGLRAWSSLILSPVQPPHMNIFRLRGMACFSSTEYIQKELSRANLGFHKTACKKLVVFKTLFEQTMDLGHHRVFRKNNLAGVFSSRWGFPGPSNPARRLGFRASGFRD